MLSGRTKGRMEVLTRNHLCSYNLFGICQRPLINSFSLCIHSFIPSANIYLAPGTSRHKKEQDRQGPLLCRTHTSAMESGTPKLSLFSCRTNRGVPKRHHHQWGVSQSLSSRENWINNGRGFWFHSNLKGWPSRSKKWKDFFCKIQITLFKYLKLALTTALRKEKFSSSKHGAVWYLSKSRNALFTVFRTTVNVDCITPKPEPPQSPGWGGVVFHPYSFSFS